MQTTIYVSGKLQMCKAESRQSLNSLIVLKPELKRLQPC